MLKEAKLTEKDIAYYKKGCEGIKFTSEDASRVDSDRMDAINSMAETDVITGSKKRDRKDFKNDAEYKLYLLGVFSTADLIELKLM